MSTPFIIQSLEATKQRRWFTHAEEKSLEMIYVIDCETTSFDPWKNEMITLGMVAADDDLEIKNIQEYKFRPECIHTWTDEAEQVHGISLDEAMSFPKAKDSLEALFSNIEPNSTFVCHALPFRSKIDLIDYQFLFATCWKNDMREMFYKMFPEEKAYSTIWKARTRAAHTFGIENQKLDTWAKKLGKKFKHHRATDDALMTYYVYKYQQEILKGVMDG